MQTEYSFTRSLHALPEQVFRAWTDPQQMAAWWGPACFTNPVCNLDVRPGGAFYIEMKGPDGTIYPMSGTFKEVRAPDMIIFSSSPLDDSRQPMFQVRTTVSITPAGAGTQIQVHAAATDITPKAMPYLAGMKDGWNQSLDRLESLLASL